MRYEEYQVWFHAYNTAISSLLRDVKNLTFIEDYVQAAKKVADTALEKFKLVEVKATPDVNMPSEFKTIVEQVTKEAMKRGKL